jgi:hypothetical protein
MAKLPIKIAKLNAPLAKGRRASIDGLCTVIARLLDLFSRRMPRLLWRRWLRCNIMERAILRAGTFG